MKRIAVQRGMVELGAADTFVGPTRRPEDRPRWARPRLGRRVVFVPVDPAAAVPLRRDYDVPQRIAPDHSPGDPSPVEVPRPSLPIGEWIRRGRAAS